MKRSFRCPETEKIWQGQVSRRLPQYILCAARRKLRMLNNARTIKDLQIPTANRLEALRGNLQGEHSIRINDQWRICFYWKEGEVDGVEIVEYH
ncbi:MAG: type II toxin-antitoxin system RelE/ParE family toxin [Gammaproteobacteria bacterium]|nr:type II toxin-antitoxin system RelE/ParE family toxin [Gammaproteobacteria bacterium]